MFGKFWKGEKTKSRITNKIIPESNINFISIRTAIKERDPCQHVTTKAAELADSVAALEEEWMDKVNHHRTAQGPIRHHGNRRPLHHADCRGST